MEEGLSMKTAHFSPSYLIANCRRIAAPEYAIQPNWVIAKNLFAVGSRTAIAICRDWLQCRHRTRAVPVRAAAMCLPTTGRRKPDLRVWNVASRKTPIWSARSMC